MSLTGGVAQAFKVCPGLAMESRTCPGLPSDPVVLLGVAEFILPQGASCWIQAPAHVVLFSSGRFNFNILVTTIVGMSFLVTGASLSVTANGVMASENHRSLKNTLLHHTIKVSPGQR